MMKNSAANSRRNVLLVAWVATLFTSSLGIILWRELVGTDPYWWPWINVLMLVTIFSFTLICAA